eukprot:TRINITY_DN14182_c0_g1_i1.p1 TRINITY_DN14182_c0_g1~~TRINITY_DN14182_c0_g1_i1.p1  ORF type:complete len:281 (-),score=41.46 TRINITY_DN14182_c0_g1_i1:94-936(-)
METTLDDLSDDEETKFFGFTLKDLEFSKKTTILSESLKDFTTSPSTAEFSFSPKSSLWIFYSLYLDIPIDDLSVTVNDQLLPQCISLNVDTKKSQSIVIFKSKEYGIYDVHVTDTKSNVIYQKKISLLPNVPLDCILSGSLLATIGAKNTFVLTVHYGKIKVLINNLSVGVFFKAQNPPDYEIRSESDGTIKIIYYPRSIETYVLYIKLLGYSLFETKNIQVVDSSQVGESTKERACFKPRIRDPVIRLTGDSKNAFESREEQHPPSNVDRYRFKVKLTH